jgi:putative flippase GtrA
VDWIDDADSRVNVIATILADLRGIARLGFGLLRGSIAVPFLGDPAPAAEQHGMGRQVAGFAAVGAASTVAYVLLYLALRGVLPAQWANALSLLITAVANTAANRRFTFGIRGRSLAGRHQARGLLAFGTGLLLTSAALAWLHAVTPRPGRGLEVAVLVGASLLATLVRFVLYRNWVFRSDPKGNQR